MSIVTSQIDFEPRLAVSGELQMGWEVGAQKEGQMLFQKIEEKRVGMKRKFTAQAFSQYHRAVQLHTAIHRLTIIPLMPHTARTDHYKTWEKQPAKADHSCLADSDCEI